MTISQETRQLYNAIKTEVKKGNENWTPYLSGSANRRSRMYKEITKYEEYANIDFDLGVINKEQHEIEIKSVRLFEKALANYQTY